MKLNYNLLAVLLAAAVMWPGSANAQNHTTCPANQDTCVVEWEGQDGFPIHNALRNTILNDENAPEGRVYVLRRGGLYWISDRIFFENRHLRIVGETEEVLGANEEDFGPAVIQRVQRPTGEAPDAQMLESAGTGSHLTMRNVWIQGMTGQGNTDWWQHWQLNASDSRHVFDNVIFDRTDWMHLAFQGARASLHVMNSTFRNIKGTAQIWQGRAMEFSSPAVEVIVENNTFINVGFTPFHSEAGPPNYFRFNHNTLVNVGRTFSAGSMWREAYVANNIFVNPYWHGESHAQYNPIANPERVSYYGSFFGIGAMPAAFGTNLERRIVLANNSWWRDPAFENFYPTYQPEPIRPVPFVNDTTMGWFNAYEGMVMRDNYVGERPNFATYPSEIIPQMIQHISDLYNVPNPILPATPYYWDPNRPEDPREINWPLPEDFSYTNAQLLTGGTDGLPLGDLNWFPEHLETFEANREQFVADIEAMAGEEIIVDIVDVVEAEHGVLEGDASIQTVEGFTYFFMQSSGQIEWTFEIEEGGLYGLDLHTNMMGQTSRGQHIRVNGISLINTAGAGEYFFCAVATDWNCDAVEEILPLNGWTEVEIRAENLHAGAEGLNLQEGTNTIRISPAWGWQAFAGFDIVDANGNVIHELRAPDAEYALVQPRCEDADWCAEGFQYVMLGAGGNEGSVSFNFDLESGGTFFLRVFSDPASDGGSAEILVDGVSVSTLPFTATGDLSSPQFDMGSGVRQVTIRSSTPVAVDQVYLMRVGMAVSVEDGLVPQGFTLHQNYPNPFSGSTTTIRYTIETADQVSLKVYNLLGQRVATLVDGYHVPGTYEANWDTRDTSGNSVASGVYIYRIETGAGVTGAAKRMVFIK